MKAMCAPHPGDSLCTGKQKSLPDTATLLTVIWYFIVIEEIN